MNNQANINKRERTRISIPGENQEENAAGGLQSPGASAEDTIIQEFQQFMWTHRITTMDNAKRRGRIIQFLKFLNQSERERIKQTQRTAVRVRNQP